MSLIIIFFFFIILQFLLLLPYYFFYKRYYKKKGHKTNTSAGLLTFITPIIAIWFGYQILFNIYRPWLKSKKFNSIEWKKDERSRYRMINDMIKSKSFIGKTKNEIIQILGGDYNERDSSSRIAYSTNDPDGGSLLDDEVVVFYLDEQQKVTKLGIDSW